MSLKIAPDLRQLVDAEVQRVLAEVVTFRHERHRHPELSWQEHETAKAVAQRLRDIPGVAVREGVGRLGVVGLIEGKSPGPTVALRADMDALPIQESDSTAKSHRSCRDGVMHACGHDGHMANLLGTALVLSRLREHLRGRVKLIFQPAEEGGAGAEVMCQDGVLEDPKVDVIFGLHGWPELALGQIYLRDGAMLANTNFVSIKIKGTGCHAAMPHLGTDQVLIAARIIEGLQSVASRVTAPTESVALSITKISGGTTHNVIPASVEMSGTLRTLSAASRHRCVEAIEKIAGGIAKAHGAEATVEIRAGYPATINEERATAFLEDVARQILPAGAAKRMAVPSMGGEDFAYYAQRVPASFFFLGVDDGRKDGYPSLHHPGYDFNDAALPIGIKMMVHAALAYASSDRVNS